MLTYYCHCGQVMEQPDDTCKACNRQGASMEVYECCECRTEITKEEDDYNTEYPLCERCSYLAYKV